MRIQHNISAMNSYRNFSSNASKLNKNLEKLSTGYKINRAGDDAAGLAISEKMRAQITGIEGATKNAKDGISLIQTAEGALTEVHDMLNRMTTLAEQSANGTYDDNLDREQLQKEVDALKSEIDRIADSTNFNGLKLLDGSLSGAGGLKGNVNLNDTVATAGSATISKFDAASITATAGGEAGKITKGDELSYTMTYKDAAGKEQNKTIKFTVSDDEKFLVASDGTRYAATVGKAGGAANKLSAADFSKAVLGELQKDKDITAAFDIERTDKNGSTTTVNDAADDTAGVGLKFTAKVKGTGGAQVTSSDTKFVNKEDGKIASIGAAEVKRTLAYDTLQKVDLTNLKVLNETNIKNSGDTKKAVEDNTFTIDGKKFILMSADADYDKMKEYVGDDVTMIKMTDTQYNNTNNKNLTDAGAAFKGVTDFATSTAQKADMKNIAAELTRVTGRNFSMSTEAPTDTGIKQGDLLLDNGKGLKLSKTGKALDLQIGDTADSFNKMSVQVKDMHSASIGIGDVDISNQQGAADALDKIKQAINNVSDQRGSLGALQNRLDHTINNLGVMRENIQNAESTIRDTDVAEEMMTYTKNNILNQSAQAMLAQANQLPQGVLQLLG